MARKWIEIYLHVDRKTESLSNCRINKKNNILQTTRQPQGLRQRKNLKTKPKVSGSKISRKFEKCINI